MKRGTRVGQAYIGVSADGSGINKDIADSIDDSNDEIGKSGDRAGKEYGDNFDEGFRARMKGKMEKAGQELAKRLQKHLDKGFDEAAKDNDAGKRLGDRLGDNIGNPLSDRLNEHFDGSLKDMEKDHSRNRRVGNSIGDDIGRSIAEQMERQFAEFMDTVDKRLAERNRSGGVSRNNSLLRNDGADFDFGRLFGKGSRNNFLNLLGKTIGGITDGIVGMTKATFRFGKTFSAGMSEAGEDASMLARLTNGAGAAFGEVAASIAAGGPAMAGGVVLVTIASSILVSVLSALLAIVTALVSTILSALVGAAAVGSAALLAMAAAGGLVVNAFMSMTNAQHKALVEAFRPIKAEMVGIGQLMLQQMVPAFHVWSENMQRALLLIAPVAHAMGSAFAQAGSILTQSFSGPGFQAMSVALSTYLPSIIRRLSVAVGGFLNGLMGMFAALMPMVNRFAGYLASVGKRFSAWANSTHGRNAIVDFVSRALDSLHSLWDFTREFFGFFSDLLFSKQAQQAGNSMFDSMAAAFHGFREAVRRAIANGDLQKWFDKAIKFGGDLWSVMKSLYKVFVALDSSGVLAGFGYALKFIGKLLEGVAFILEPIIDGIDWLAQKFDIGAGSVSRFNDQLFMTNEQLALANQQLANSPLASLLGEPMGLTPAQMEMQLNQQSGMSQFHPSHFNIGDLISSGTYALNHTDASMGGWKKDHEYKNPYTKWAQQFIDSGPSVLQQVRKAIKQVSSQFYKALDQAGKAMGSAEAKSILTSSIASARDTAQSMVDSARSALSSAAQTLASASSKKEAAKALKDVQRLRGVLQTAINGRKRIERAIKQMAAQKTMTQSFVDRLLEGDTVKRATLADYAAARQRLADKIAQANQKLADAIAMRKQYAISVADSVNTFGSLLTAQAKTVDGIEQALTYEDITSNLQSRLDEIRTFQDNLRKLLAMGLSNAAYKQLVDAGVEAGGAYAAALVSGGSGAVQDVNSLVGQINDVAQSLGQEAASRLYDAGIEVAQGVVDGLKNMRAELDKFATDLGHKIAQAVYHAFDEQGGGKKGGGGKGGGKGGGGKGSVVSSRSPLVGAVAVSPEVAAYASSQSGTETVSGNTSPFRDLVVHTPTENPKAVAFEVLNELTGRL